MRLPELESVSVPMGAKDVEKTKKTLLVVDDEEGPRQSLRMVFRNDYHVHAVESGEKAVEYVRNNPIHVAILDIRMAGQSGIEVLRQIKAISPSVEVIMLTAYETLETARQAIRRAIAAKPQRRAAFARTRRPAGYGAMSRRSGFRSGDQP